MEITNEIYQDYMRSIDLNEILQDVSSETKDIIEVHFEGEKYLVSKEATQIFKKELQSQAKKLMQQSIAEATGLDSISAKHMKRSIQDNNRKNINTIYRTIGTLIIGAVLSNLIATIISTGSIESPIILVIIALVGGFLFNFKRKNT